MADGTRRSNKVRYVFTDPCAKELFVDWADIASDSVAHLRAAAGHRPDDPELTALVAELHELSPEFRRLWPTRELRRKVSGRKEVNYPTAGRMSLDYEVLNAPQPPGQRLAAYTATPGTPSHSALSRLVK
ncbi:hypothetical protein ABZU32_02295 [Sphaerisporangium sp. NPDC005288]|uniref:MmyB family transcriptional regulator n=1 Tax=Sphaerisporangium sp. NPDC005288 TaxID=3155114 RepID=UPI0033B3145C